MWTSDYEKFKFLPTNRDIDNGLVKRLMKSIDKIGFQSSKPILVNINNFIIDGQHRYLACKELGIPFFMEYMDEHLDSDIVIQCLNKNQNIWKLSDYITSGKKRGIECYIFLSNLEDKYHLGSSNNILIGLSPSFKISNRIKAYEEIELNKKADEICKFIKSIHDLKFHATKQIVGAIVKLFDQATTRQINIIHKHRLLIVQQATVGNYLRIFENIINSHSREKISLR
jgi:hypothetical protein